MAGLSDKDGKKGPDEPASDARASEGLDDLMTTPAAAMAAATAFGLGLAAQMGRLFLGSLQGAMEVTGQLARQLEEERKATEAGNPAQTEKKSDAPAEPARTEVAATQADAPVKATKPGASKSRAEASAKAKVAKPKGAPKAKPAAAPKAKVVVEPKVAPAAKAKPAPKVKAEARGEAAAPAPKQKKTGGKADDLKRIDGIGPKVEQVLKGRGITRLKDLADMDEKALVALDKELGLDGRVLRDDWAGQARHLAGGKARSGK
jgi:NADH-quinone oxidoreductase subunit E